MVWGGMFTGLYNVTAKMYDTPLAFFQGARAFLPLVAVYICLMMMILYRMRVPPVSSLLGLFFYYCLVGLMVSLMSPKMWTSLYWGGLFLAPLLVCWVASNGEEPLARLRNIIHINYFVAMIIIASLIPQALAIAKGERAYSSHYELVFGLGQVTKNGVGRFSVIVILFSLVRLLNTSKLIRYALLLLLLPAGFLLMQTQSRTALLGLAVMSCLFVLIRGLRWQFLLAGPAAAYVVWVSGFKWRAQANLAMLIDLTGREFTWKQALDQVAASPFLGWGFHSDRILLEFQHMHNSYLHALLHSGAVGLIFFVGGWIAIWFLLMRKNVIRKIREKSGSEQALLIECFLIVGVLTSRSVFESTAAFYGVDLLFLIPAVAYLTLWVKQTFAVKDKAYESTHTYHVLSA
jgi:O-antigen ligase